MNGVDKAALRLDGHRIIERQVVALRQVTDSILLVGGSAERFAGLGLRAVPDVVHDRGALGGIYSALVAADRPRTLIVACDMPFLNVRFLRRLVQPTPSDVDAVIPRTHAGFQPLCAVYAERCASAIRQRIQSGLLEATALARCLTVEEIGPEELATYDPDGLMFVNVNTPHDYDRAKDLMDRLRGSQAAMGDPITDATS